MTEWDDVYAKRQWGHWPNTRFVEWAMRTFGEAPNRRSVRFLELGCGAGAQVKFLLEEGFNAFGVDSSQQAIFQAMDWIGSRYPTRELLWLDDIRRFDPGLALVHFPLNYTPQRQNNADLKFDCIFDVCTLQHLERDGAVQAVRRAFQWLKPGGYMFSMHQAVQEPPPDVGDVPDPWMLTEAGIQQLFGGFELRYGWEIVRGIDGLERRHWIIEARKPHG